MYKSKELRYIQKNSIYQREEPSEHCTKNCVCCVFTELWLGTSPSGSLWTHERMQQATSGWCMCVVPKRLQMCLILYPKFGSSCTPATGPMILQKWRKLNVTHFSGYSAVHLIKIVWLVIVLVECCFRSGLCFMFFVVRVCGF